MIGVDRDGTETPGKGSDRPHRILWRVIGDDLRRRMTRGEFDERFPTDRQLMDMYGASRHTVREAIRGLQEDGLIIRRRGKGSFRTPPAFALPLGTIYSLFRSIEDAGVIQTSVTMAQEKRHDPTAAEILGVTASTPLFYLQRTRLADGLPLAVDHVWLPLPLASPLLTTNFARTALYDELRARCGVVPEEGSEVSRPVNLDRTTALHLGLSPGDPAFQIDRRTFSGGRPLEWRTTIVRGDRYAFKVEWHTPWDTGSPQLMTTDQVRT